MKATLFIKENVIRSLQNLIDKECLSGFALGIATPWGEDLRAVLVGNFWEQGFVARATRVCRRCDRVALQYSPTAHICAGTPK